MKWNKKYNYSKNRSKLPSVTRILDFCAAPEKKEALKKWAEEVGFEESQRITKEAKARGSEMHKIIEQHLKQEQLRLDLEETLAVKMAKTIINFGVKGKLEEIWGVEVNTEYEKKYKGVIDVVGVYEGSEKIIDLKQTNKPKRVEFLDDYFSQICGYANSHNKEFGTKITSGVILMCSTGNQFQKFEVSGQKFVDLKDEFMKKVEQYYKNTN
mgnify:FL=1